MIARIFDLVGEYWPVMERPPANAREMGGEAALEEASDHGEVDDPYLAADLGVEVQALPVDPIPDSQVPPDSFSETQVLENMNEDPTIHYVIDSQPYPDSQPFEETLPESEETLLTDTMLEVSEEDVPQEAANSEESPAQKDFDQSNLNESKLPSDPSDGKGLTAQKGKGLELDADDMELSEVQFRIQQLK